MTDAPKTIEFKVERTIPAPVGEVFDAWLDPTTPGNPWSMAEKLMLDPKVDGLFYWAIRGTPHFGRFTAIDRPARVEHTWMSPNTLGAETTVSVTFRKQGADTLMTLVHSGLPDNERGRSHEGGWNYFLGAFLERFEVARRDKGASK